MQPAESASESPAGHNYSEAQSSGACNLCKQMKIKCEKEGTRCKHCNTRGTDCIFSPVEKRTLKMNRRDHLASMEHRIERIEEVFNASGLASSTQQDRVEHRPQEDLADSFATLVVNEKGDSKYIGSASPFSLLSPQGIAWVNEKTGSSDLAKVIAEQAQWDWATWREFRSETWQSLPGDQREPLPIKEVALRYVDYFFESVNSIYPIYNRRVFNEYFQRQYSDNPPDDTAWYASLHVVLAIGSIFEQIRAYGSAHLGSVMDHQHPALRQAWKYLRNASSCFIELVFKNSKIMAVQAVIAMALMMQMNPNPQASYTLIAAAGRIALRLGIHRYIYRSGTTQVPTVEIEQRCNVFWIIYILDKGACLRSGCPPTIHDEDIGIHLPDPNTASVILAEGYEKFSVFRSSAELASIESRVYSELYSARAGLRPLRERLGSIARLDKDLERFKEGVVANIRPGYEIICRESHFMAVLLLHFSYYDCLETLHRASVHHQSWFTEHENAKLQSEQQGGLNVSFNPRIYSSTEICMSAARSMAGLVKYFLNENSQPREGLSWMAVYYPLSASLSLFANLIRNPEDLNASEDLSLMELILMFLSNVMTSDKSIAAGRTFCIFQELHHTAAAHVAKAIEKSLPREKRKRMSDEQSGQIISENRGRQASMATDATTSGVIHPPQPLPSSAAQSLSASITAPPSSASIDADVGLPEYIPGMGMASFEWEMTNLLGWAEGDQSPDH